MSYIYDFAIYMRFCRGLVFMENKVNRPTDVSVLIETTITQPPFSCFWQKKAKIRVFLACF